MGGCCSFKRKHRTPDGGFRGPVFVDHAAFGRGAMPVLNIIPVQSFSADDQRVCVSGEMVFRKLLPQQTQMAGSQLYEAEITIVTQGISKRLNAGCVSHHSRCLS